MTKLIAILGAAISVSVGALAVGAGGATRASRVVAQTTTRHYTEANLKCDMGTLTATVNERTTLLNPATNEFRTTGTVQVVGSNGIHRLFVENYTWEAAGGLDAVGTSMINVSGMHTPLLYTQNGFIETNGPPGVVQDIDGHVTDVCHAFGLQYSTP
jgi:hypothetical protein